ncbi:hypothetical protein AFK20_02490 [Enhydrobacter aerosaccus]|uniref:Lipopolysaccharide glycosyltransferase n=1 Tax=Enhydrobacter aerosaccus TaxID=225324 RepID=A0ABR5IQB9_9HYPH|nr:hypothetical protein AFK20_02490 [Enhydrobacter aerosaccus]
MALRIVNPAFVLPKVSDTTVHILASGPSIQTNAIDPLGCESVIFVNGSISLTEHYKFDKIVAYVITDPRFIKHNCSIPLQYYQGGYPLYISALVAEQLWQDAPDFLVQYADHIYIIYPVDRPIDDSLIALQQTSLLGKIAVTLNKRTRLKHLKHSPYHTINKKIGVSWDIRYGFVEGGTVALVALQLAYSLGFQVIHLYGIDLINSQQPRFYENQDNAAPTKLDKAITHRIVPSFDWVAHNYQQKGVQIYNHSPISKDLFTFIPYRAD